MEAVEVISRDLVFGPFRTEWLRQSVDDAIRRVLLENPKLEVLRQTARRSGHYGFQEEGLVLVAKGATSLPELMRVLKQ